jgi:hypothetical protein
MPRPVTGTLLRPGPGVGSTTVVNVPFEILRVVAKVTHHPLGCFLGPLFVGRRHCAEDAGMECRRNGAHLDAAIVRKGELPRQRIDACHTKKW